MRGVSSISFSFILFVLSSRYPMANSRRTPIVETPVGPVRGLILRTVWNRVEYSSFRGIPYAKPPLGDLRFKPPLPAGRWKRALNAFKQSSVCPQMDIMTSSLEGREDCLYLNVFTPEVKFKRRLNMRPVMVWIHGGGYFSGYSNSTLYGPDFFMEEDVVLVSFNYRLGVLGFLALNHPDATGNVGLKDQHLVLRWVQNNIVAFGGDPKKVTIFGESAGSTSVGFHILSERSRGLFHRSISMSGTPLCPWAYQTPTEATANAYQLASKLKFVPKDKDDLLNYLRRTSALDLVNAGQKVALNLLPFRPTIEDPAIDPSNSSFLTECPITKYHNGDFYRHTMMLGYTHDEIILFLGPPIGIANMIEWAKNYLQNIQKNREGLAAAFTNQIAQFISKFVDNNFDKLIELAMNIFFRGPIDLTQRILAKHNSGRPVYYYRLCYRSKYAFHKVDNNPLNGTAHFDDVGYIFNANKLQAPTDPKNKFNRFRKKMVSLWANFAKYGDPTPRKLNQSTQFDTIWIDSGTDGLQLNINATSDMRARLTEKKTEDYEKLLYKALPLVTSCMTLRSLTKRYENILQLQRRTRYAVFRKKSLKEEDWRELLGVEKENQIWGLVKHIKECMKLREFGLEE